MPRWLYFLIVFAGIAVILEYGHMWIPGFPESPAWLIFVVAALGIVPFAALIGKGVEGVAEHTGEQIGGLLFATFGNATELIIAIFALSQGLVDVVRASLIGTILGNVLLVLGISVCIGGFKYGRLKFEARPASQYASLLALCIGGLVLPSIGQIHVSGVQQGALLEHDLSDFIAIVLLIGYFAFILFSVFHIGDKEPKSVKEAMAQGEFELALSGRSMHAIARLLAYRHHLSQMNIPGRTGVLSHIDKTVDAIMAHESDKPDTKTLEAHAANVEAAVQKAEQAAQETSPVAAALSKLSSQQKDIVKTDEKNEESAAPLPFAPPPPHAAEEHKPSLWGSLAILAGATIGVALLSEILVGSIEPLTKTLGWNEAFVGLVFVPLIGGLPEYFNTISMALEKRIGMVLAASAGSSIQIALLVAPILVLISLFTVTRLDLVFSIIELAVLAVATFLFSEITKDGELVWLEGLLLILLFGMMAGTVFFFGA